MDWGVCHYLDKERSLHKVPVFVMILGASRVKYIEFVKHCDLRSMERCMINIRGEIYRLKDCLKMGIQMNPLAAIPAEL